MNDTYRKMMEQQNLSAEAMQAFERCLRQEKPTGGKRVLLKTAIAAVCIAALLPVTVFAVESIFGVSLVRSITGETYRGRDAVGYEITYTGTSPRPLSDFAEEIQMMDDHETKAYSSWQEAEEALGITLLNNPVLFGEGTLKEGAYNLAEIGLRRRVHCFADYEGINGQLYRATVTAGYRYDNMSITVRSTVTCEHPDIDEKDRESIDWIGVLYEEKDIEEIRQEQYTAENGMTATIISIVRKGEGKTDYEATFTANGASYRITIDPNVRDSSRDEEAKAHLIEILEGFEF